MNSPLALSIFDFKNEDILYYYDGPRLWTIESESNLFLVSWFKDILVENQWHDQYLVVPISPQEKRYLMHDQITLFFALNKEPFWLVDSVGCQETTWTRTSIDHVDPAALPNPSAFLGQEGSVAKQVDFP